MDAGITGERVAVVHGSVKTMIAVYYVLAVSRSNALDTGTGLSIRQSSVNLLTRRVCRDSISWGMVCLKGFQFELVGQTGSEVVMQVVCRTGGFEVQTKASAYRRTLGLLRVTA